MSLEEYLQSIRLAAVRSLQPQRRLRIRVAGALSPNAEVDRPLQPAGRPARLLEHAGAAPPARSLAARLRPLDDLADALHRTDRAFFYSAFRLEEVQ